MFLQSLLSIFVVTSVGADNSLSERAMSLSQSAHEEVAIIGRIQSLREATEKLPEDWTAVSFEDPQKEINRKDLLANISEMEIAAAERWNILVNNLSILRLKEAEFDQAARFWAAEFKRLNAAQKEINKQIDQYNSKLKEAILMNLAEKIQISSKPSEELN